MVDTVGNSNFKVALNPITGVERFVGPSILKSIGRYPEMAWTFANRGVYRPPYAPTSAQNVRNRKCRKILDRKKNRIENIFFSWRKMILKF